MKKERRKEGKNKSREEKKDSEENRIYAHLNVQKDEENGFHINEKTRTYDTKRNDSAE